MKIKLIIAFLLFCFPAWATVYKVSSTDGSANFATPALAHAFTKTGSFVSGDQMLYDNCDPDYTTRDSAWYSAATVNNYSDTNPVTFGAYGSCTTEKPTWDITADWTMPWTAVSGEVYKANTVTEMVTAKTYILDDEPSFILEDDVKIKNYAFTTDEATTAALLTRGSWALNRTTKDLYIRTSDGAAPATHTISYAAVNAVFNCNRNEWTSFQDHHCGGITIDGLEFKHTNVSAITTGSIDVLAEVGHGIQVKNSNFVEVGGTVQGTGDNFKAVNNTVYRSGSAASHSDNNAIFAINNGQTFEITGNRSYDGSNLSSLVEINFASSKGVVSGNWTNASGHGIELFSLTHDVTVEKNTFLNSNTESGTVGVLTSAGTAGNGSYNITVRNNIFQGHTQAGIRAQFGAHDNTYSFNTFIAPAAGWSVGGVYMYDTGTTATTFGNIFTSAKSGGQALISTTSGTTLTADYNTYYTASAPAIWATSGGTTYDSFAAYKTGSSQDANSAESNPTLNATGYPLIGSPVIDAISCASAPATDIVGTLRPQGSLCDRGAYEYITVTTYRLGQGTWRNAKIR